jgi:hypothetical protein
MSKRAVNECSNANWPAWEGAYVGDDKPFVIKVSCKLLFESTNMGATGDEVTKKEYIRALFLN